MKKLGFALWLLTLSIVFSVAVFGCGDDDDDDDDNDTSSPDDDDDDNDNDDDDDNDDDNNDDDDNDDNDDNDDDDNDDDDDDTTPVDYPCADIADGLVNTCEVTLEDVDGIGQDQSGVETWCGLSEELLASRSPAPFWQCMGECVYERFCDLDCLNACAAPADPGSGCASTVHGVYACGVVFLFAETRLYIPEMDLQAYCEADPFDWDCAQGCVDSLTCSDPPTSQEALAMITCVTACY